MINSYTNVNTTVEVNGLLPFDFNSSINYAHCSCRGVSHIAGTPTFTITNPGRYLIIFNGTGANNTATTGEITVSLLKNGVVIPGATASETSADLTDVRTVGFSTVIEVLNSCNCVNNQANLVFQNTGVETIFSNYNVAIVPVRGVV